MKVRIPSAFFPWILWRNSFSGSYVCSMSLCEGIWKVKVVEVVDQGNRRVTSHRDKNKLKVADRKEIPFFFLFQGTPGWRSIM